MLCSHIALWAELTESRIEIPASMAPTDPDAPVQGSWENPGSCGFSDTERTSILSGKRFHGSQELGDTSHLQVTPEESLSPAYHSPSCSISSCSSSVFLWKPCSRSHSLQGRTQIETH